MSLQSSTQVNILSKETRIPVKTVAAAKSPITTKGGMTILPDTTIEEITLESSAILLLPGADLWLNPEHTPIIEKAYYYAMMQTMQGSTSSLYN
ncbi:DJ-1/PfpI family protein [Paenibacillus solani]|uniref:DJ-1/PfpI family protein n=1 Tax=Paenibacillus solani TaxID=1705565 RepID=UPI003D29E256